MSPAKRQQGDESGKSVFLLQNAAAAELGFAHIVLQVLEIGGVQFEQAQFVGFAQQALRQPGRTAV